MIITVDFTPDCDNCGEKVDEPHPVRTYNEGEPVDLIYCSKCMNDLVGDKIGTE